MSSRFTFIIALSSGLWEVLMAAVISVTEKTYYLKQQSPILHFQYADRDATLRATELKPKLDRFIGEWLKRDKKGLPPEWRMKKSQEGQADKKEDGNKDEIKDAALDYRVRILNTGENTTYDPSPQMPYFGNMGKDVEKKKCVMTEGCIKLHIRCYIKGLLDTIDECLPTFFLTVNFGTRQDKGFGSFVLCGDDGRLLRKRAENEELLTKWYGKSRICCIRYKQAIHPDEKLGDIDALYKILKSGINDPPAWNGKKGAYVKSYLWKYFDDKNIDWEKKALKCKGIAPAVYNDPAYAPIPPRSDIRYVRGLLGIGDQQQWFSSDGNGGRIVDHYNNKNKPVYKKETIFIESDSEDIKRIPSPLTFKIIGNAVYILPGEIDRRVPGSSFTFKNEYGDSTSIQIPSAGEFDFGELMNGFKDKVNSTGVKQEFAKRPEKNRPAFIRQGCGMEVLGDKP